MTERVEVLRALPLFSRLDPTELEEVAGQLIEEERRKGETICREGDAGDRFYVVLGGELDVLAGGDASRLVQRLGAGDFFGETSLLLGVPRTATIAVRRAARLLALDRPTFERTLLRNPRILEYISRVLSKRLAATTRGEVDRRAPCVVAVTGEPGLRGKSLAAAGLAEILHGTSGCEVLLIASGTRPGDHGAAMRLRTDGAVSAEALARAIDRNGGGPALLPLPPEASDPPLRAIEALLHAVGTRFAFVILDLGLPDEVGVRMAEEVADVHVRIVAAAEPRTGSRDRGPHEPFAIVNLANAGSTAPPSSLCEPFVLRVDPALAELDLRAQARHLCRVPRGPVAVALHRLARKLLGTTVGLALGGGAAFGIAHIGVLQVFEKAGVPIDLLAGTSMGSVVALSYAAGMSPDEMASIACRIGTPVGILRALDVTVAKAGLFAGTRMIDVMTAFLNGARHFEDLVRPCRTVATDIETGERVEIGTGRLDAAFRASCSVPLIWAPVRHQGRVLVDGVMVDPVPAASAYAMGADLCVAINVIGPPEKNAQHLLARVSRWTDWVNPLAWAGDAGMPNILDVYMNSLQILWHELGSFKAISADLRVHPDLSGFTWTDFHRPAEIIARGVEAAERALPDIEDVLRARVTSPTRAAETIGTAATV